ncbi:site-specific DNA-methyltransferase [Methylocapsa sp. D3K7]|nr:site-specific DNA-methyltransferase [Methylocapsa sp. D3K7]WGJ16514.1 site-specific DNA-methyltransferase [Methylocapsa sp. D3K7]
MHPNFLMASGEMTDAAFTVFLTDFLRATSDSLVLGAVVFVFIDWRHLRELLDAGRSVGLTLLNVCVWNKGTGGMGSLYRSQHELVFVFKKGNIPHKNRVELGRHGRCRTNVWNYPGLASFGPNRLEQLADHPTTKNCAMIADAIRDVSDRNDIIIDPFCGSGTAIIAAAKTGRRACTIELDPKYVDVAVRRWERWCPTALFDRSFKIAERANGSGYQPPPRLETAHRRKGRQCNHATIMFLFADDRESRGQTFRKRQDSMTPRAPQSRRCLARWRGF